MMKRPVQASIALACLLAASVLAGCSTADSASGESATAAGRHAWPLIYVTDFSLDPAQIEKKEAPVRGREGLLGNRPHLLRKGEPAEESHELVRLLTESIVEHLKADGFRAQCLEHLHVDRLRSRTDEKIRFEPGGPPLPNDGWLVIGWFDKVEEGSAAAQATVGFGAGSGNAEATVAVADLARDPERIFLFMGSESRAKKMPGGLITMNPYVMAAKFVMAKRHGMEKDVKSLGAQIASSLVQYIDQHPELRPPAPGADTSGSVPSSGQVLGSSQVPHSGEAPR